MLSRIDLSPIRDLRSEKPVTKAGQVRWAWADIKAALAAGHSLKTIAERLRDCGIEVRYRHLAAYVSRLRRGGQRNVKEREENRPGFQFDPEPDPKKLI